MPIISVKSLPLEIRVSIPEILRKLNVETAKAIGYEPRHVWSYWEFLEPHYYAIGENPPGITTDEFHSPIVNVISFEGKESEHIETMLKTIAGVISSELKIDISNIFITYSEALSGRVFDGGNIVKKT